MSKKKGVTKSHSVNDVPVGMRPSQMLEALEEGHFEELLGRLATPSYTRKSEGCLTMSNLDEQKEMKLNWMENNLREKDNEEQRQMRDEKKRRKDGTPFDSRNPPSTSPPGSPQHSNANLARSPYYSYVTDDRKFDYIDAGGDGPEDVEMADLSKTCEIKAEVKTPIIYTKGNVEETVQEWPDWNVKQPEVPFMGTSSLEDPNKVDQKLRDDLDDDDDDIAGRSLRSRHLGDLNSLMGNKQERPYGDSQYTRLDTYSGTLHSTDRLEESKFLQSKKRLEKKKQKANKGVRTVGESEFPGVGTETTIEELVASIEGNQSEDVQQQERRRRQNNPKKDKAAATIGNHNGKAPAAAQSNKSQNPTTTGSMNKDKKSPNKKNKKGATNDSTTPVAAEAPNPTSDVAQPAAPAKRTSTEDAEEEYLSADEGVASTVTSTPSDVMIDGANYRADSDDVSNLEKEVNNEAEFVTVTAKKKSSMSQNQNQRNGSTGKVERRGPPQPQQPRRNSMEDPRLNKMPPARHHPQPQNISLGDYLNEKKPETHTKVKMVPFKESKKKHERLESTADSDYMDANEEMVLPIASTNESVTPERGFSYADAAKKSAEQSRENSPACANLPSGTPGVSPSPPPAQRLESAGPEVTSSTIPSKSTDDSSSPAAPVLLPENAGKSADSTGLSFFYDESAGANNAEADNQSADSPAPTNNPFVLAVNGKTIQFARGMAVDAKPVDENHRALADIMLKRWNAFVNEGPAPIYYEPPVQV